MEALLIVLAYLVASFVFAVFLGKFIAHGGREVRRASTDFPNSRARKEPRR